MTTYDSQQQSKGEDRQAGQTTHLPILGLIESLQQHCQADTPAETFIAEVLRGFVALAEAHYGAFWTVDPSTRTAAIAAELMPQISQEGARGWAAVLGEVAVGVIEQAIIRYQPVSEPAGRLLTGQQYVALGFPVRGDEGAAGCVTVVVRQESGVLSDAGIAMLRLLADFGLLYSAVRSAARFEAFYTSLSSAWEVVGEALAFTDPQEMAHVLADRARTAFGAERVSVGFVGRSKVTVKAISGEDILDKRSNVVRLIQAAQTEVLVSGEPGFYAQSAELEERTGQMTRNPQHERLVRESRADAAYSVPLRKEGDVIGVWTLEFGSATPLTQELRQVIDVASGQVGPVLHLSRHNARGPFRRIGAAFTGAVKWVLGKEHPWRKAAGLAAVAVLAYAVLGRVDLNISGSCVLEPSFRRVYTAPFETTIRSAPVRPGDTVVEGQVIVEFDRDDLELRLREVGSSLTSAEKEMDTYLAQQKMPQYAEARARWQALSAEKELLERRIARAEVRADFAGIVIVGDLSQDIGRPVRMGEHLIEVAPLDTLVLDVEIDQGDIGHIGVGQEGRFTTKAQPDVAIPFRVAQVRPTPEIRNGVSVYVAEATVQNADGWLRPGMEGAAKVRVGRGNVTWVFTRKLVNWLRLHLWW